ncbi:MAG TPA: DNA-binding protein [Pseudoxanthomonas sp.]
MNTSTAANDNDTQYLTPEELHARWRKRVAVRTLSNWRSLGTGPKFTKIGGRILYPLDEIIAWEGRRTTDSTSNYAR